MAVKKLTPARYIGKVCQEHPEFEGIRDKGSRACIECRSEKRILYRLAHPEKDRQATRKWMERNREVLNKKQRERNAANPEIAILNAMTRKMEKIKRIPPWADIQKINKIYADCPPDKVVDHIVPLRGKLVSGLHVHNNLQYLSHEENSLKSNNWGIK